MSSRDSPAPSLTSGSIRSQATGTLRGSDVVRSLLPVLLMVPVKEKHFSFHFTRIGRWNRDFLEEAIIHFLVANAQWRMQAWLLEDPDMPITILLSKALSFFIPFHLEMPVLTLPRFTRTCKSCTHREISTGLFYKPNFTDELIDYLDIGVTYVSRYKVSVLALLSRPNTTAF